MVRKIIAERIRDFLESVDSCTIEDIQTMLELNHPMAHLDRVFSGKPDLAYKIIDIGIPSAITLQRLALLRNPQLRLNELHEATYGIMLDFRTRYYCFKVDRFLSTLNLPNNIKHVIRTKLLQPVQAEGVEYSNFMEEVSRRISQTFQPVSGKLAELAVEGELKVLGLQKEVHYRIRPDKRTDIGLYYPSVDKQKRLHKVEIKNVSLRERAERGKEFDGDSLLGFFNQPEEFSDTKVKSLDDLCVKTNGYCYVPPKLLAQIKPGSRFRPNTQFAPDMKTFVESGTIPSP